MNPAGLLYELKPYMLLLLQPPVPLLALIMVGAGLLRQHRALGRTVLLAGLIGLWLCCTEGAAQWLSHQLLRVPPALSTETIEQLREEAQREGGIAVLVLGGGANPYSPEYDGATLRPLTLERLRYGVWLSRRLGAPLGFSGGIGWNARHLRVSEASLARRTVEEEYGARLRWAEDRSRDTRENAALSLALLKADGVRRLLLVSHDMHLPRALQAFGEVAGNEVEIIAAPVGLRRDAMSELADWCPSSDGFSRVRYAIYEWLGRLAGR
ncbi:YdcF family protein [Roseateles violae]|uniref:YdcF family protein n=1 Tax=Roseateles violae TaxID=3058042 RepID=A0ABT8DWK0_9BURK|nr:YdcF family protein [Pelomonas sp. PFR6]MDN3920566.1 YdcF family protein [Pelomonas sp. PFR6]